MYKKIVFYIAKQKQKKKQMLFKKLKNKKNFANFVN